MVALIYFFHIDVVKTMKNELKIQVPCNFCKDQFGQRCGLQNTLQIHVNFTKNSFHKTINK